MSISIKRLNSSLMTSNQAAIGGAFLVGFFICWFVYAYLWDEIIFVIGGKNNLSGWAQAIGGFAAIFSGFMLAASQDKKRSNSANQASISVLGKVVSGILAFEHYLNDGTFDGRDLFYVRMHRALLDEYLQIARTISFSDMEIGYPELLLATRASLVQLIAIMDEADGEAIETNKDLILITDAAKKKMIGKSQQVLAKHKKAADLANEKRIMKGLK